MTGIYSIINLKNGKRYIGQSINVSTRIKSHFQSLSKKRHPNKRMQKDYLKDFRAFNYEILEYNIPLDSLSEREKYWVDHFQTLNKSKGYNEQKISEVRKYAKKNAKKYTKIKDKHVVCKKINNIGVV